MIRGRAKRAGRAVSGLDWVEGGDSHSKWRRRNGQLWRQKRVRCVLNTNFGRIVLINMEKN